MAGCRRRRSASLRAAPDAHRWVAKRQRLSQPLDIRQGTEQAVICFGKCLATKTELFANVHQNPLTPIHSIWKYVNDPFRENSLRCVCTYRNHRACRHMEQQHWVHAPARESGCIELVPCPLCESSCSIFHK